MSWYWIILIIVGYIIMGGITAILVENLFDEDNDVKLGIYGVIWPPIILGILLFTILAIPFYLIRFIYIILTKIF